MSELPIRPEWVRLWHADFLAGVSQLGAMEAGVYTFLLLYFYQTGKPLPQDFERVCRIARATEPETRRAVEYVLHTYWVPSEDPEHGPVWRHLRAEQELEWATRQHYANVLNGRAGGQARARNARRRAAEKTQKRSDDATDSQPPFKPSLSEASSPAQATLQAWPKRPFKPGLSEASSKIEDIEERLISFGDKTAAPSHALPEDEPASNPKEVIWSLGVKLLTEQGGKPAAVRSFLGKLAQLHGEAALARGVLALQVEGPAEGRAWLTAWLMHREGDHGEARGRRRTRADDNIAWYNAGFEQLVRQLNGTGGGGGGV